MKFDLEKIKNIFKPKKEENEEVIKNEDNTKVFIKIEGKSYEVLEWSTIRCVIKAPNPQYFLNKRYAKGEMLFIFDDEVIKIENLELEFIKIREDMGLVAKFNNLTPQQKEVLNYIISNNIVKQIITPQPTNENNTKKNIDFYKIGAITTASIVALVSAAFIYDKANQIDTYGFVDKEIFKIKSPVDGYIYLNNQSLFYINDKLADIYTLNKEKFTILAPLNGSTYEVKVKNKEFVKKGEEILIIIPTNANSIIKAFVPIKSNVKEGMIVSISIDENNIKGKIVKIKDDINLANHSFEKRKIIYIKPFKSIEEEKIVKITIDPLLNKLGFIKEEKDFDLELENELETTENNKTLIPVITPIKTTPTFNLNKPNKQEPKKEIKQKPIPQVKEIKKEEKPKPAPKPNIIHQTKNETKPSPKPTPQQTQAKKSKMMYCIIVASTKERHPKQERLFFLRYPNTGEVLKLNNYYVMRIGKFSTEEKALRFKKLYVNKFYKDAFITKCKAK